MTTLRLTLLGEFAVSFGDDPQRVAPAGQRLLALLCVDCPGRRARRSVVAERLWPDQAPGRAASHLRAVLWRLPRPHGRVLVRADQSTLCLADEVEVDLTRAGRVAESLGGERELDEEALGLLATDLLPDWDEPWLDAAREGHRQQRLHALERAALRLCREGRYSAALAAGLAAVRAEPLRESAHRQVIAVHLAEGNHAEALRQYEAYRRQLAAELGLRPSPAIRTVVAPLLGRPLET